MSDSAHGSSTRLSALLHEHYTRHFAAADKEGHAALQRTLRTQSEELTKKYMDAIDPLLEALKRFGYPQRQNQSPRLRVRAELHADTLFKDNTKAYYAAELPATAEATQLAVQELPEKYNGLGFKNLIYMILQVKSFRDAYQSWEGIRPRAHLIMVEEPEVHLHPQMQSVFIKEILPFLDVPEALSQSQLMLTTHSPHIAADSGFAPIRYFRRKGVAAEPRDLLNLQDDLATGDGETLRFLNQYMTQTRCDLLFADKAILFEGSVERLLLPPMIQVVSGGSPGGLLADYIAFVEVGGAYAHRFRELLSFLGIPTLVITDIDAVDEARRKCAVAQGMATSNATLRCWLPQKELIADLLSATETEKVLGNVRVAYQVPEDEAVPCARSFEEAFIYKNSEWLFSHRDELAASASALASTTEEDLRNRAFEITQGPLGKVDLALDLMLTQGWTVPRYIAEGLSWLAGQAP